MTKQTIMDTIIKQGHAFFTEDNLAESELFTLFAEQVAEELLRRMDK